MLTDLLFCDETARWAAALAVLAPVFLATAASTTADDATPLTADEAAEIAREAYYYAYPMVLMDVTRRLSTNCTAADGHSLRAPVNQFANIGAFPDASFTDVVRPNADTLYSSLWFDVTSEPLVIHVPDSGGRYYLLPMLDMWSDVFASPGKRTTGTAAQTYLIAGPGWQGEIPAGMALRRAPTPFGWIVGRTQTNGPSDYANVHRFQAGLKAVPLSAWGSDYQPPPGEVDPEVSAQPPVEQVARMDAAAYFSRFAKLTKANPPHANDYPILAQMRRLGLEVGQSFDLGGASPLAQKALAAAVPAAQKRLTAGLAAVGREVNHWRLLGPPIGTYGTDYYRRALIAYGGLGANVVQDAVYPTAYTDAAGRPFDSAAKYVLEFAKDDIPPVRAFWSLTMYNDKQFFAANPIDRYAIGDRDKLKFNRDGSLTLYIQRESPGADKQSNWLPAPASGGFSMNLRLYWPQPAALNGTWAPSAVKRVD